YVPHCDAMIIGSHFKEDGLWSNALNYDRVAQFMEEFNKAR
ncbi:MAG: SgcQ protein, partial [Flavobacteriaceae bacterium]|nr:SgcQ protein [Flavobacteriaceae bacterium]